MNLKRPVACKLLSVTPKLPLSHFKGMSEAASEEDAANSEALADSAGKPVAEGSDADDESEILSDKKTLLLRKSTTI